MMHLRKCLRIAFVYVLVCVGSGLRTQLIFMCMQLCSCIRGLFLRLCICGNGPTYAGSFLHAWALTRVCETFGRNPTLPIFTSFPSFSFLYAILTLLFAITSSFSLHSYTETSYFPNSVDVIFPFLQSASPYASKNQ